jgi:hypothetical protein
MRPKRNEVILEELNVDADEKKVAQYKLKWLKHVTRQKTTDIQHSFLTLDLSEQDLDER